MSLNKTNKTILTLLPIIAVASLIFLLVSKKRKHKNFVRKEQIAEEGYETAGDILFPQKRKPTKYRPEWN